MCSSTKKLKILKTPILFLVFNRPNLTNKVFKIISKNKPSRLYVAADGPRPKNKEDVENVNRVREIVKAVDWPCEVKTLFRKRNLGCKKAISDAIDWFFVHEEEGIIIEDDCLPNEDFFYFCQNLLNYHRDNNQVFMITGNNYQNGIKRGSSSYYYSKYVHIWGWATWKRAWRYFDRNIKFWADWKNSADWNNKFTSNIERKYWEKIFDRQYLNQIDTWDYSWSACLLKNNGLIATPNVNLVRNIGFGEASTHTNRTNFRYANTPLGRMHTIIHPNIIKKDEEADKYNYENFFGGKKLKFPLSLLNLPKTIIWYFYNNFYK